MEGFCADGPGHGNLQGIQFHLASDRIVPEARNGQRASVGSAASGSSEDVIRRGTVLPGRSSHGDHLRDRRLPECISKLGDFQQSQSIVPGRSPARRTRVKRGSHHKGLDAVGGPVADQVDLLQQLCQGGFLRSHRGFPWSSVDPIRSPPSRLHGEESEPLLSDLKRREGETTWRRCLTLSPPAFRP